MLTRPTFVLLTIVCLAALALAGCVAEIAPEPVDEEPVTITFSFPYSQNYDLYQPIAEAFEQSHPNVTIHLRPDPTGQWVRDEGNAADTFVWWPDPTLTEGETPLVLGLDALLTETDELAAGGFYPRAMDMFRWDGALWALPAEVDLQVLFYNADFFDTGGVAYPRVGWTWNDLLSTAQRVTTVEGDPWSFDGHYGLASNPTWGDFAPFIYQHGGDLFQFDDVQTEEAIRWYADLALEHGVMLSPRYIIHGDTFGLFQQEKAAMWIGFLGDRDGMGWHHLRAPWEFDWGIAPLPGDQTEATLYRGQGYYITSHSAHVEQAWAWIQYLSSRPVGRGLPARRSTAESSDFREMAGDDVAAVALYAVERIVPRVSADGELPETLETYARTVESVVNDGERRGIFEPPETPEKFALVVESVVNGELTPSEAMAMLRGKALD